MFIYYYIKEKLRHIRS